MLRQVSRGLFFGSLLALAACGSSRIIRRDQTGGILELQGDRGKAMEQAGQEMSAHCGANNFTITQEGEEPVGTDTVTTEDQQTTAKTSKNGRHETSDTTTTNTQSTRTVTAWRVHYQCGAPGVQGPPGADQPPPAAPPPADQPPPPAAQPGY